MNQLSIESGKAIEEIEQCKRSERVMGATELQPLPEAHLAAAELRRQAKELLLIAQRLEASCPLPARSRNVEFMHSKKKRKEQKVKKRSKINTAHLIFDGGKH